MKRPGLAFLIFFLSAPIGLYFVGRHLDTGEQIYLNLFYAVVFVYIILSNAVVFMDSLKSDAAPGVGRAIGHFGVLFVVIFAVVTLGWLGYEKIMLGPSHQDTDFFVIMQKAAIVAPAAALVLLLFNWVIRRVGK